MQEPSKEITMDDLPTEEEINEWTERSRKEGICGIADCFNKPAKQCKNAPIITAQNIFPRTLTCYQMATLNTLLRMKGLNNLWMNLKTRLIEGLDTDTD